MVYTWTSIPEGFESDASSIVVSPEVPTWYYVTVTDDLANVVMDSILILVYEYPVNNLGDDQTVCGEQIMFD